MDDQVDETPARYGYLGPATTFTHAAVLKAVAHDPDAEQIPYPNVRAALADVLTGRLTGAMVPIENSVEGGVSGTLDALADTAGLTIVGEEIVPITFALAARQPLELSQIREIGSHTHAQAQCQHWLLAHAPDATLIPTLSTAAAARDLAALPAAEARGRAVLCSPLAAEQFGLEILRLGVGDNPDAVTRFVLVARDTELAGRTGADKTSLVVHLAHNRAGALMEMLEQFVSRGVNLSRIESRPLGDALGRYSFSIDAEGHLEDERVADALRGLHRVCPRVVFLGSYPRADQQAPAVRPGTSDKDYVGAEQWVTELLRRERR